MDKKVVRAQVEEFRVRTAHGASPADCFPAWYLHRKHVIPETRAIMQSSDSAGEGGIKGYDFGLDAYYLDQSDARHPKLVLIQAKYSESLAYISRGFRDLVKAIPTIKNVLNSVGSDVPIENKVIVNLRAALNKLDSGTRQKLEFEFIVIHLCDQEDEIIFHHAKRAREDLRKAFEDEFPDRVCYVTQIGPPGMVFPGDTVIVPPPPTEWAFLTLNAVSLDVAHNQKQVTMYYGTGHLAELVELYRSRRDNLFSKNVRYFLASSKNTEKGPSAKMRDTLEQICVDMAEEPEVFAFYHNGITILGRDVDMAADGIRVCEPYVLNGCQTIKTAYLFHSTTKNKINDQLWQRITVPLRIVRTRDENLVRQVTINNNRQNAISAAALRANDPIQIQLEERFRKAGIFYERQEGAFASIEDRNPEIFEEEYENTRGRYVNIIDLARSIAAVAGNDVYYAHHANELFENDQAYKRCFSDKRLASIVFLTFLQNLHDVIPLVLKMDLGLVQTSSGPKPSRFGYYAMCLLARYLAREQKQDIILEFGQTLWGRQWQFRQVVAKLLDNYRSRIKGTITEKFLTLEDSSAVSLNDAFKRAEASLGLSNDIDVFNIFKNLDRSSAE